MLSKLMSKIESNREIRAERIAIHGQVVRVESDKFVVESQTTFGKEYHVSNNQGVWHCQCADHVYRGVHCKHILAIISLVKEME